MISWQYAFYTSLCLWVITVLFVTPEPSMPAPWIYDWQHFTVTITATCIMLVSFRMLRNYYDRIASTLVASRNRGNRVRGTTPRTENAVTLDFVHCHDQMSSFIASYTQEFKDTEEKIAETVRQMISDISMWSVEINCILQEASTKNASRLLSSGSQEDLSSQTGATTSTQASTWVSEQSTAQIAGQDAIRAAVSNWDVSKHFVPPSGRPVLNRYVPLRTPAKSANEASNMMPSVQGRNWHETVASSRTKEAIRRAPGISVQYRGKIEPKARSLPAQTMLTKVPADHIRMLTSSRGYGQHSTKQISSEAITGSSSGTGTSEQWNAGAEVKDIMADVMSQPSVSEPGQGAPEMGLKPSIKADDTTSFVTPSETMHRQRPSDTVTEATINHDHTTKPGRGPQNLEAAATEASVTEEASVALAEDESGPFVLEPQGVIEHEEQAPIPFGRSPWNEGTHEAS